MIYVFGVGNILMGDDGFGALFAQKYKEEIESAFPGKVKIVDIGTHSVPVVDLLQECRSLYFIDAMAPLEKADKDTKPNGESGQKDFRVFSKEELTSFDKNKIVMSSHSGGILEILQTAELLEYLPEKISLIGVVPKDMSTRIGLTPELESKLPIIKDYLIQAIGQDIAGQ